MELLLTLDVAFGKFVRKMSTASNKLILVSKHKDTSGKNKL